MGVNQSILAGDMSTESPLSTEPSTEPSTETTKAPSTPASGEDKKIPGVGVGSFLGGFFLAVGLYLAQRGINKWKQLKIENEGSDSDTAHLNDGAEINENE